MDMQTQLHQVQLILLQLVDILAAFPQDLENRGRNGSLPPNRRLGFSFRASEEPQEARCGVVPLAREA